MRQSFAALFCALLFLWSGATASARSVGGGISVFIPESLLLFEEGSVSVESSLATSFSVGDFVRFPIGVKYNQVYGLLPEGENVDPKRPWLYADSLMSHLSISVRIPAGPLFVDVFGGGILNWNPVVRPLTKNIERDLAPVVAGGSQISFTEPVTADAAFGYGWRAGAGVGVTIDQISVDVNAAYRTIYHDLTLSGPYQVVGGSATGEYDAAGSIRAMLRGLAVGVHGSFTF